MQKADLVAVPRGLLFLVLVLSSLAPFANGYLPDLRTVDISLSPTTVNVAIAGQSYRVKALSASISPAGGMVFRFINTTTQQAYILIANATSSGGRSVLPIGTVLYYDAGWRAVEPRVPTGAYLLGTMPLAVSGAAGAADQAEIEFAFTPFPAVPHVTMILTEPRIVDVDSVEYTEVLGSWRFLWDLTIRRATPIPAFAYLKCDGTFVDASPGFASDGGSTLTAIDVAAGTFTLRYSYDSNFHYAPVNPALPC